MTVHLPVDMSLFWPRKICPCAPAPVPGGVWVPPAHHVLCPGMAGDLAAGLQGPASGG